MKKQFLLLCFGIFLFSTTFGQPWPYVISSTTQPFTNLVNPISLNNGEVWTDSSYTIPLTNFIFAVNGVFASTLNVGGATFVFFPITLHAYYTVVGTGQLLKDKGTTTSLSPVNYEFSGPPGSQILKIEWLNAGFRPSVCTDTAAYASFQIWLFESDDHLELHYGPSNTNGVLFPYGGPFIRFKCYGNYAVFIAQDQNNPYPYWVDITSGPFYSALSGPPDNGRVFIISHNPLFIGLMEQSIVSEVSLSPNPSKGVFNFTSGNFLFGTYTIIDSKGMELFSRPVDNEVTAVDLSNFPDGMYFLRMKNEHGIAYQKMIKQ